MISPRALLFTHQVTGEFPVVTFPFEVELLSMTITTLLDLFILVSDGEGTRFYGSIEDVFFDTLKPLGKRDANFLGDLLLLRDKTKLWQLELGKENWTFVRDLEHETLIFTSAVGPFDADFKPRYALCSETSVTLIPGGTHRFSEKIEKVVFGRDGFYVLAGKTLFRNGHSVIFGNQDVINVASDGNDVYVCVDGDWVIFQEDAVRYSRCKEASRLCAEVTDQGNPKEAQWDDGPKL